MSTLLSAGVAYAGPQGGSVVGGSNNATISTKGDNITVIDQNRPNVIINWNTFNVGKNETVQFNQANSSYSVLNRVTGPYGPSWINGTISAIGSVFIVNRDGIIFGPHANINTGNFLATTSDIRDHDFKNHN